MFRELWRIFFFFFFHLLKAAIKANNILCINLVWRFKCYMQQRFLTSNTKKWRRPKNEDLVKNYVTGISQNIETPYGQFWKLWYPPSPCILNCWTSKFLADWELFRLDIRQNLQVSMSSLFSSKTNSKKISVLFLE
jgi:hypothetical protein